jgi:hypothetical protein
VIGFRAIPAAFVSAVLTAGLVAMSGWPAEPPGDQAVIRLSWRVRSPRVQQCRALSAEEIAAQPEHMRRTEECEGRVLPYELEVLLDGRPLLRRTVRGGGAREDRPVYVFDELGVPPGRRRLAVRFTREEVAGARAAATGDGQQTATPAALTLEQEVELRPDEVLLITYDADRRALVARSTAPARSER